MTVLQGLAGFALHVQANLLLIWVSRKIYSQEDKIQLGSPAAIFTHWQMA